MKIPVQHFLHTYGLVSEQVDTAQLSSLLSELQQTLDASIEGAIVEFGCYIGTTTLYIRRILDDRQDNRAFHVYDSFEGLPPKQSQDNSPAGLQFQAGALAVTKKQFLREFQKARLQAPIVHKGWFSDLTATDVPPRIAFAFLDGDFYESISDSLRLTLPRMAAGGRIIIDDYAREALPGVAKAVKDVAPQLVSQITVRHNQGIIHL